MQLAEWSDSSGKGGERRVPCLLGLTSLRRWISPSTSCRGRCEKLFQA